MVWINFVSSLNLDLSSVGLYYVLTLILPFIATVLFCGECKARSVYTNMQSDLNSALKRSELKSLRADDNFIVTQNFIFLQNDKLWPRPIWKNMYFVFNRTENIVWERENAGYQYCLLSPQCFQKSFYLGSLTLSRTTNFRLFQTERVCRRQTLISWKWQKVLQKGR